MWDPLPEHQGIVCEVMGPEGSGKTHFAGTWPSPVFADTEGRAGVVLAKLGLRQYKRVSTWEQLRSAAGFAVEAVPPPATFVVDSGSDLQNMAEISWLAETGQAAVFPKVLWAQVWERLDGFIGFWRGIGWNLVITERMKPEYDSARDGYTGRLVPDRYKKTPYKADLVIELYPGLRIKRTPTEIEWLPGWSPLGERVTDRTVARVHKNLWQPLWETKPILVDVSYAGLMRDLRAPWRGVPDDLLAEIAAAGIRTVEAAAVA